MQRKIPSFQIDLRETKKNVNVRDTSLNIRRKVLCLCSSLTARTQHGIVFALRRDVEGAGRDRATTVV